MVWLDYLQSTTNQTGGFGSLSPFSYQVGIMKIQLQDETRKAGKFYGIDFNDELVAEVEAEIAKSLIDAGKVKEVRTTKKGADK